MADGLESLRTNGFATLPGLLDPPLLAAAQAHADALLLADTSRSIMDLTP